MFETRKIARAMIDAFTAQPSANRNTKRIRSAARAFLGCMAVLTLLLGTAQAGAQGTVAITINTNPAGLGFTVDGGATVYTTQQVYNWVSGNPHQLTAVSPQPMTSGGQTAAGEAYICTSWLDTDTSTIYYTSSWSVTPQFSADTWTANFVTGYSWSFSSPNPAQGTVVATRTPKIGNATPANSPAYLAPGETLNLTATPTGNFYTSDWKVNGVSQGVASNSFNYTLSSAVTGSIQPVFAQVPTFVVNTNKDDDATFNKTTSPGNCTQQSSPTKNATDTACTLRDAVAAANIIEGIAAIYFDTTVFKAGNTAAQNTIFLTGDDLEPSTQMNIVGPGANILTVDGSNDPNIDDIFYIGNTPSLVTISGMTIAHGNAPDGGGAIFVDYQDEPGNLTVTNVVFDSNVATYDPPDECNTDYSAATDASSVHRTRTLHHATRAQSKARALDTAPSQPYTVTGGSGGAIWNVGELTVIGSTFTNNSAFSGQDKTIFDSGGAIFNIGDMAITESTFVNNNSDIGGAIDDEYDSSDSGCDECELSSSNSTAAPRPVARLAAKPNLETLMMGNLIQDDTFVGNTSTKFNSGAISVIDNQLEIDTSIFTGNTGAIYNGEPAAAVVINVARPKANVSFHGRPKADISIDGPGGGLDVMFNIFYNDLGNESTPLEDDCTGSCTMDPDYNITGFDTMLMPLANYGGTTPTMLPQPSSVAICMLGGGLGQSIPNDQRGYPRFNSSYQTFACQDIGAVQTNYALAFTTNPPAMVIANAAILPAPVVTLTESGKATTAGGTVGVTGSTVSLGKTVNLGLTNGTAVLADLTVPSAISGEIITATLPMNPTITDPALNLIAVSTPFNVVSKSQPSIVASVNTPTSFLQDTVTLKATVSFELGTPTGSVTFLDGTTSLGTGTLTAGVATLPISTLAAGSHSITVSYAGDVSFLSGTSAPVTEFVEDFTVTLVSTTATSEVLPGSTLAFTFNVAPPTGQTFPDTINLSLSGLPAGTTYSFSPTSLLAGKGATDVTLTVNLPKTLPPAATTGKLLRGAAPFALALLLLPFAGRLRRSSKRLSRVLPLLLLLGAGFVASMGLTGCTVNSGFFGQNQQTYTVTVTGTTSGHLSRSATVTLTVE